MSCPRRFVFIEFIFVQSFAYRTLENTALDRKLLVISKKCVEPDKNLNKAVKKVFDFSMIIL